MFISINILYVLVGIDCIKTELVKSRTSLDPAKYSITVTQFIRKFNAL